MTLASFNAAPADEAMAEMLACCSSPRFARAMTDGQPYESLSTGLRAVNSIFESMTWDDALEAFKSEVEKSELPQSRKKT